MTEQKSPAASTTPDKGARKRIPMSIPRRKLEVPDIEGYHLHWFVDANVPRAQQGGYEMVRADEVPTYQFGVGTDTTATGSADLGGNVKVVAGTSENGHPHFLNLMKIKLEWWKEDSKEMEKRNAAILSAIFRNESIPGAETQGDRSNQYGQSSITKGDVPLFNRPPRK